MTKCLICLKEFTERARNIIVNAVNYICNQVESRVSEELVEE